MSVSLMAEWLSGVGWEVWLPVVGYTAAVLAFALGVLGCVLPYPGHLFIVGGCALWACSAGAPYPPVWMWVVLAVLALLGSFADTIFALLGARRYGCSRAAIWCSALGMVVGVFFFPLGLLIGPFAGAFAGELLFARRSLQASAISGLGALLGTLVGTGVKFIIAGVMLLVFFF